jgi:hypothetical protein
MLEFVADLCTSGCERLHFDSTGVFLECSAAFRASPPPILQEGKCSFCSLQFGEVVLWLEVSKQLACCNKQRGQHPFVRIGGRTRKAATTQAREHLRFVNTQSFHNSCSSTRPLPPVLRQHVHIGLCRGGGIPSGATAANVRHEVAAGGLPPPALREHVCMPL